MSQGKKTTGPCSLHSRHNWEKPWVPVLPLLCYPDQLLPLSGSLFRFCTKRELQSVISEVMRFSKTLQHLYNQGGGLGALGV